MDVEKLAKKVGAEENPVMQVRSVGLVFRASIATREALSCCILDEKHSAKKPEKFVRAPFDEGEHLTLYLELGFCIFCRVAWT
jgi:hypothetical protein